MGYATMASGDYSTAMGFNTQASESYSTATGANAIASGTASTAMGLRTTASGGYTTARDILPQVELFQDMGLRTKHKISSIAITYIRRNTKS